MDAKLLQLFASIDENNTTSCMSGLPSLDKKLFSSANDKHRTLLMEALDNKMEEVALEILANDLNICGLDIIDSKGFSPLMLACINGMEDACLRMLSSPTLCALNATDVEHKSNALMFACEKKLGRVCKKIIKLDEITSSYLSQINNAKFTSLSYAIISNMSAISIAIIKKLSKSDLCHIDSEGNTYLHEACFRDETDVCMELLKFPLECNLAQVNDNKNTCMLLACSNDLTDVCMMMLQSEEDCNLAQVNNNKDTALIKALYYGMSTVAMEILSHKNISLNCINSHGKTALILSCEKHFRSVCDKIICSITSPEDCALSATYVDGTALTLACKNSWNKLCMAMLCYPDDCVLDNISNNHTALLYACYNNMENVALEILKHPTKCALGYSSGGLSALSIAIGNNMDTVCMKMLEFPDECSLSSTSSDGSPLMKACQNENNSICMKILEYPDKCALDYVHFTRGTILMYACNKRMEDVCMKILETPDMCLLNHVHPSHGTSLLAACKNNLERVGMKILAHCELSTLAKTDPDYENYTALAHACRNKMTQICVKLLDHPEKSGFDTPVTKGNILGLIKENKLGKVLEKILEYNPNEAKNLINEYLDDLIFQTLIASIDSCELVEKIVLLNKYRKTTRDIATRDKCLVCYDEETNAYYLPKCNHVISMCDACKPQIVKKCCPICRGKTDGIIKSYIISF